MVIQRLTGFMVIQGAGGPPLPIRNAVADKVAAMSGVMSALAALWARERNGGKGQKGVVKMLDSWAAFISHEEMKNHTFVDSDMGAPLPCDMYRVFETRYRHGLRLVIRDDR